jgi:hypothetical protein
MYRNIPIMYTRLQRDLVHQVFRRSYAKKYKYTLTIRRCAYKEPFIEKRLCVAVKARSKINLIVCTIYRVFQNDSFYFKKLRLLNNFINRVKINFTFQISILSFRYNAYKCSMCPPLNLHDTPLSDIKILHKPVEAYRL